MIKILPRDTDQLLWQKAAKGDLHAFESLYNRYWELSYAQISLRLGIFERTVEKHISKSLPNGRVFNENKHYLFPIPTEELILNPNLEQDPGW